MQPPALPAWLERQLPFRRALVDVGDGLHMHVMEQGAGRPVVMLHGNPTWGYLWRKVALALVNERLRIIMPDLVGLGLSDKPRDPALHTLENHARWLGALLDTLVPSDAIVFVGQDWGGPIGLRALAEPVRAARVAGLILANTVIGPPRPDFKPTAFHRFARLPVIADVVFRLGGFPQGTLAWAQGDKKSIRGEVARAYRWPLRHIRDRVAPLALASMVPDSHAHPTIAGLARCQTLVDSFKGPAAIVWGDRDPILGRVRSHVERHLPAAQVTRTQAGHLLQEEVPDAIAAAVRDVTRRAPA
ncbi:MAG TPA: alpha/beta fold hydrolase [Polyangia bacterium]